VPGELELLEFLGDEPIEQSREDGLFCYAFTDSRGVTLHFSFSTIERSVQTTLALAGSILSTVTHELADRMQLLESKLRCEFSGSDSKTVLIVRSAPTSSSPGRRCARNELG
jgi:hypothetical protein